MMRASVAAAALRLRPSRRYYYGAARRAASLSYDDVSLPEVQPAAQWSLSAAVAGVVLLGSGSAVAACEEKKKPVVEAVSTTEANIPARNNNDDDDDSSNDIFASPWHSYLATSPSSVLLPPTTNTTVTTQHMYFYHNPQILHPKKFVLFAGPASTALGNDIAHCLGLDMPNQLDVKSFADGETSIQILDSVRGKNVYVVQSTISSDALLQLLILIPTLRRASAKHVTVLLPYYGYSRQDMRTYASKSKSSKSSSSSSSSSSSKQQQQQRHREPIAAADVARMLEDVGVDRVICMDLHSDTLLGFFSPRTPVEHILPSPVAAAYFYEQLVLGPRRGMTTTTTTTTTAGQRSSDTDGQVSSTNKPQEEPTSAAAQPELKITVVASHEGQVGRATQFRQALLRMLQHPDNHHDNTTTPNSNDDTAIELAVLIKNPHQAGGGAQLVGHVDGRQCILVDDIVNTGTTLETNITTLAAAGAASIHAWATHGVFTKEALQSLRANEQLEFLLVSNSVPPLEDDDDDEDAVDEKNQKIRVLNLAPLLAEVIARVYNNHSLRGLLKRTSSSSSASSTTHPPQPGPEKTIERYDG